MAKQNTINQAFTLSGKGLHSGLEITLTLLPAPSNYGIKIKRVDLPGQPLMDALAEYVGETTRGTVLKKGEMQVSTVEHALSALYALGIDNCLLEVNAPEFPILDGSARYYVEQIQQVGIKVLKAEKNYYKVTRKMECSLPETGAKLTILPADTFSVEVHIGFKSTVLSSQFACLSSLTNYATEIAGARTFVFVREIEPLLKQNLIKGGDLKNAIVIYDKLISQPDFDHLADIMHQPHQNAATLGYLNGGLKFDNEPACHKLLDVIGDLSLIGKPMIGKVIAYYPGHKINTNLAKMIHQEMKEQAIQAPHYAENLEQVYKGVRNKKADSFQQSFL